MLYANFEKDVEQGKIAPVYVAAGREPFLALETQRVLRAKLVSEGMEAFDLSILSGDELDRNALETALLTFPMGSQRRLVIVRDFLKCKPSVKDFLKSYCLQPNELNCLLLLCFSEIPADAMRRNSWIRKASKIECKPMYGRALHGWIRTRGASVGLSLSQEAVAALDASIGNSLGDIANELEKLATVSGGSQVEASDVYQVVGDFRARSLFELCDAAGQMRAADALAVLRRMMLGKVNEGQVLRMLYNHFTTLHKVEEMLSDGASPESIARATGKHIFILKGMLPQARLMTRDRFRNLLDILFRADYERKAGRWCSPRDLELCVLRACEA